ncbi:nitrilase-related carbon-nitrogen hydrolase [Alicyclobacillus sp.]|uniref:nitrilase-related carbon-nitrogen hydrolase n=1 Tax=Alicyclobacillus sp. TaxID=61169 RepID=UPI0025B81434|nr:nitrilase-related carbon-nitrogen hydrolase [Alicyclobacillus sp.]MCL6516500.1 acyltransferase [Alicyclobacillus sp.]
MTQRIQVALGQVRPVLGDVGRNVDKHLQYMAKAREQGADVIVFPELGLTGYQVQDLTLEVARPLSHPDIHRLVRESRSLDVVFSFVEESDAHLFHISSVYAAEGEVRAVHRKVYLPTYGMFDEGRYFAAGGGFQVFTSRLGATGMLVCEDAWHATSPYLLAMGGASVLILPAASPARNVMEQGDFGSQAFWRQLLQVYAQLFGTYIVFVNRVGLEDGVNFFGGSGVVSPQGEWLVEAPALEEGLYLAEVKPDAVRRARYTTPLLRDERADLVWRQLGNLLDGRTPKGGLAR